jgi:CheY-like chemotaxis protein
MSAPRRLVVVDDDPKVRQLMERAFKAPEFETHAFPTGRAALERVAEIQPHCVVSDLLMPDMDGERFLRAMRETAGLGQVPFVFVSAVRSEARIRAVLEAGASAFMVKPFPLRDLIEKVRKLVEEPVEERVALAHAAGSEAAPPQGRRSFEDVPPTVPLSALSGAQIRAAGEPGGELTRPDQSAPRLPRPDQSSPGLRQMDLQSTAAGAGFGRYTRVDLRGRSLVVLTEAAAQPKFVVTTVVTEKGQALRKVETALPHPLARDEDNEVIRRQVDMQHESVLERIEELVLDGVRRRVLWSDQSRSVDPDLLAWAVSALAQLVETEVGTEETNRVLLATHERATVIEDLLRVFHITPTGRVLVDPSRREKLPRRAVSAVAGWCVALAIEGLQVEAEAAFEPIRHATHRRGAELERLGFYGRLRRR